MSKLIKLHPQNRFEIVTLIALVGSLFTGWPRIEVSGATLEPIILIWSICGLYMLITSYTKIRTMSTKLPWITIFLWVVLGSVVALLNTTRIALVGFQLLYLIAALCFVIGLYCQVRAKQIRVDWLLDTWLALAVGVSILAVLQFVLGAFTNLDVLFSAYQVGVFEFPRIHLFMQEPQYLANWLLVPLFISIVKTKSLLIPFVLFLALFLTLARGAFVSLALLLPLMYIVYFYHKKPAKQLVLSFISAALCTLVLVGVATTQNSNMSFMSGVGRYLDHATLGIFNAAGAQNIEATVINAEPLQVQTKSQTSKPLPKETFVVVEGIDTEGVVEASTLGRLEAIRVGIDIFNDSPQHILIGTGLYRFGEEAKEKDPQIYSEKLITNNQYVQVLVETGLLGFILYFGSVMYLFVLSVKKRYTILSWALIALLMQYMFFSTYTLFPFWILFVLIIATSTGKFRKISWHKNVT